MKVHILKADLGGSGFYRIEEPVRVLRERGLEVTVATDADVEAVRYADGTVRVTEVKIDADILILQRPLSQHINEVARVARDQGMALVVDLDDDFHNVHPDNIAAASVDPKLNHLHNKMWLWHTTSMAHVVTTSTPALLKYAHSAPTRGVVVRNRIPERALSIVPSAGVPATVGWTGTVATHPQDMQRARGALGATDLPFAVVGDLTQVAQSIDAPEEQVFLASSWVEPIERYWQVVADSIGVGVAPLEMSKFNKAKSWLKPAEYCALGIPFVGSPTPEYIRIATESAAGHTASSAKRWQTAIDDLYENREKYSQAARHWARMNTLEAHAHEWLVAWELANELKKGRK